MPIAAEGQNGLLGSFFRSQISLKKVREGAKGRALEENCAGRLLAGFLIGSCLVIFIYINLLKICV